MLDLVAKPIDAWAARLPELTVGGCADGDHPEIQPALRMRADRSLLRAPTRRLFVDYRANADAYKHLRDLPGVNESLHGVISGKYALFDLIPALIERTGQNIATCYIATLGFSKQNGADLCGLIDAGHVGTVAMVCSHYFQKTSQQIYDAVIPALLKRQQRVVAMRSHAKMILARMADDTCYTCESSANLRSCVNVEQFVLTCCPHLYAFHRQWLEEEILIHDHQQRPKS
jgi:hypothetical protein